MEEQVEYMTYDEIVMSKQEESNYEYAQSTKHLEDEDDVDEWLNAEIKKHMSMHQVKIKKDSLIRIIKSIRQEMRNGIKKRQIEASTSDEVYSIASNDVDKEDYNTSKIAPCLLPKKLSPRRPFSLSLDKRGLVKRWHVCKPIHVTYDDGRGKDCRMWPTCDPNSKFCFGYDEVFGVNEHGTLRQWISFRDHERRAMKGSYMGFVDFLQVRYRQQKIDGTTREHRYYEWVAQNHEFNKHMIDNLIRSLPLQYKRSNTNTTGTLGKANEAWHNEGYEEDEMWQSGDEKTDYDPPYVNIKTFEVKRYSFKEGHSFVCITDREDDALLLGRVNGAQFKAMIRKELEDSKYVDEMT
nr:hypothetical protein [Tanacetum cinerariifolium]